MHHTIAITPLTKSFIVCTGMRIHITHRFYLQNIWQLNVKPKDLQPQRLCTAHLNSIHLAVFDDNGYTIEFAPFATSNHLSQIFFTGYCKRHIEKVGLVSAVNFKEPHSYIFWFVLSSFFSLINQVENIKLWSVWKCMRKFFRTVNCFPVPQMTYQRQPIQVWHFLMLQHLERYRYVLLISRLLTKTKMLRLEFISAIE